MTTELKIRSVQYRDAPAIEAIDQAAFARPWPWTRFAAELGPSCSMRVAVVGCSVLGFLLYRQVEIINLLSRCVETHRIILRTAVRPWDRRRGTGRRLIADQLRVLRIGRPGKRLAVEVDDRNLAAQLFLKSCGFRAIGIEYCGAGRVKYRMLHGEHRDTVFVVENGEEPRSFDRNLFASAPNPSRRVTR